MSRHSVFDQPVSARGGIARQYVRVGERRPIPDKIDWAVRRLDLGLVLGHSLRHRRVVLAREVLSIEVFMTHSSRCSRQTSPASR